jgi:glutamine synthetase adenylyltransferase
VRTWIEDKAAATLNPPQVENTLEGMEADWSASGTPLRDVVEQFPLGEAALLHLISVSSVCAARFVRHPEILHWLSRPEISKEPRPAQAMLVGLQRIAEGSAFAGNFRALRFWKGREMTRIALREIA